MKSHSTYIAHERRDDVRRGLRARRFCFCGLSVPPSALALALADANASRSSGADMDGRNSYAEAPRQRC